MRKLSSLTAVGVLLAAPLGSLLGCRRTVGPNLPRENLLVVALANAPTHLDPRLGSDQASSRIYNVLLNGLVTKDPQGNLVPDLAESWEILDHAARYRFHLRPGVRFHDGRELSASDVVWTFQSLLDGTVPSPKRGAFQRLARVEAINPTTVDFVMSEPYGALLVNLTSYLGIVPAGSEPEDFNRRPVGTGPFRLVERQPDKFVFEAFDDYWQGRPNLDRLVLRVVPDATVLALELEKGSVQLVVSDLAPDVLARFRHNPAFRVVEDPGSKYTYLGLNLADPVLSDARVRRAMALAIDRHRLVDSLWQGLGVVTETMLPPGHWARNDELETIPYDPAAARRLLEEAGYPAPAGDGPQTRIKLTYKTSTDETAVLQAQILQAMLAEVGIAIEIRSYEFATFYSDIKKGNFQVFSLTWTGVVDPDIYSLVLHSQSIPPAGANRGRYRNPEFDRLVEQGAALAEPQRRRPFYLKAQEILARDLPYISLFIKANFAVMPSQLEGYENYPSGEFYSLRQVRWVR
ncbi:MAG: ABC transporter substrate-binding protein [Thermoanaerobaculia bacterium]